MQAHERLVGRLCLRLIASCISNLVAEGCPSVVTSCGELYTRARRHRQMMDC
jgi:hypothetical protein